MPAESIEAAIEATDTGNNRPVYVKVEGVLIRYQRTSPMGVYELERAEEGPYVKVRVVMSQNSDRTCITALHDFDGGEGNRVGSTGSLHQGIVMAFDYLITGTLREVMARLNADRA